MIIQLRILLHLPSAEFNIRKTINRYTLGKLTQGHIFVFLNSYGFALVRQKVKEIVAERQNRFTAFKLDKTGENVTFNRNFKFILPSLMYGKLVQCRVVKSGNHIRKQNGPRRKRCL